MDSVNDCIQLRYCVVFYYVTLSLDVCLCCDLVELILVDRWNGKNVVSRNDDKMVRKCFFVQLMLCK